jgi:hypothetical protein
MRLENEDDYDDVNFDSNIVLALSLGNTVHVLIESDSR